jgi:microcystin-dependent protein
MSTPFISEIKIISFNFPPKGWAFCNGQILAISQNQALFSLLGTTYGGNGQTTFALPNLQGQMPVHFGSGFSLGQVGGEQNHTLILSEIPSHIHSANGTSVAPSSGSPSNNLWCQNPTNSYSNQAPNVTMAGGAIGMGGGGQPHNNMSPYLVLNFVIALQGIFPSRN